MFSVFVDIVTPADVYALQQGHCLAKCWAWWCVCRLPMLAPRASSSADARVASILSIERDMSVVRPAIKRALVSLKSALDTVRLALFFSSSSFCIASGFTVFVGGSRSCWGRLLYSKYGIARSVESW